MSYQRFDVLAASPEKRSRPSAGLIRSLVFCACAASLLIGCGPQSDLVEVSGEVTLDGTPVESGSIRLSSVKGQKSSTSGARVRDGKFRIRQEKGLLPGTYHISISAADKNAPKVRTSDPSGRPGREVSREMIPAEYNINSQKTIDITVDGDNHFVFEIESDRK